MRQVDSVLTQHSDLNVILHINFPETERYYGKDVDTPDEWRDWVTKSGVIPTAVMPGGSNDLLRHLEESVRILNG